MTSAWPQDTVEDRLVHRVNQSDVRIQLAKSHPLADVMVQTYEMDMNSDKSQPKQLFR